MGQRAWKVNVRGEDHTVEVRRSLWTNAGQIRVDGNVVDAWGFKLWLQNRNFPVGKMPGLLQCRGLLPGGWKLYVNGRPIAAEGGGV